MLENHGQARAGDRVCLSWRWQGPKTGSVAWGCLCLSLPLAPLCMCPAGWKLLAMLALVLVVMVWYSISREDRYLELWVQLPGPSVGSS